MVVKRDRLGQPGAALDESGQPEPARPEAVNPARVYDALLGGKDNYAADRKVAAQLATAKPALLANVRANRAFLGRVVGYLAAVAGIRQFLDLGTGLPASEPTHEVAQRIAPDARIVYVDNDPLVLAHARALLISAPEGTTDYLEADIRDPDVILARAARTLDFGRPIAVTLLGVLYMIPDADQPYQIVARLMEAAAPGSYLAISHPASDIGPAEAAEAARRYNSLMPTTQTNRTREQVRRFFDGLSVLEPGIVQLDKWRPDPGGPPEGTRPDVEISSWGGVGRKIM
jgi:trans-aconitate methyltransferase